MSSKYVRDTVWQYLTANWTDTRLVDVDNLFNTLEVSGDPLNEWATMAIGNSVESQVSVGSPGDQRWREEGVIGLVVFVPSGSGTDRALTLAEAMRDLFRAKQINDGSGGETIVFRSVDPPDTVLPSAVDASSGAWFGYSVDATYYVDFCRTT